MSRLLLILALCGLVNLASAEEKRRFAVVDLKDKFTQQRPEKAIREQPEANFLTIEAGYQTLGGVKFIVGEGVVQLGSKALPNLPMEVDGIQIGRKFSELHILHATNYGGGTNGPGTELHVADDTEIGEYKIQFDDGSTEVMPIVYGREVRDWWFREGEKETTKSKVVWKGDNPFAKKYRCRLRLYLTTWVNPQPNKVVAQIDYISRKDKTVAAPFCVAMTLEEK